MLTRAARHGQALHHLEHAAEQIQLPWLCPALSQSPAINGQRRTITTRPTVSRSHTAPSTPRQVAVGAPQLRRLASAARIHDDFDGGDEYLPFSYERHGPPIYNHDSSPLQLDLSKILMIDHTTALPEERSSAHGSVRGGSSEIESTLEACIQVQRWDRAFTLLQQLHYAYSTNPARLQQAYNRVLEAMVFDLIWNRNTQLATKINKWIEVDMRKAKVDPDAHTFALKIKAALATLSGSQRDRTVRRYWDMAKAYELENEVANLRSILSDNELGKLTEICRLQIQVDQPRQDDVNMDAEAVGLQGHLQDSSIETAGETLTPMVRETHQKGLGLVSLKESLASFFDPEKLHQMSDANLTADERQQMILEQDSLKSALERWKVEHEKRVKMGVSTNFGQGKVGAFLWDWHTHVAQRIEKELELLKEAEAVTNKTPEQRLRCEYGPFLRLVPSERMAALTSLVVLQHMSRQGISNTIRLAQIVTEVGRHLEAEVDAQRAQSRKAFEKRSRGKLSTTTAQEADAIEQSVHLHTSSIHKRGLNWNVITRGRVGVFLCEALFDVAKMKVTRKLPEPGKEVSVLQPVFHYDLVYREGRRVGSVTLLPEFAALMTKQPAADLIAKQLPMVCKPRPWTGFQEGGYLQSKQPVLRVKAADAGQRQYAERAAARGDLDTMFAGLDVLSSTAWRVNRNVFNVMLEAWNSGEQVANLPPLDKAFPDVPKPTENATSMEKFQYYSKLRSIENERSGLHSNRCFQNFQMEIAKAYSDQPFYLPHNVDFRGRAYPIPPYLNQMGADNSRGLLLFDQGRELGPFGLKWLQVHLANVFGYDKASLRDRAAFAVEHLDDIRDSVENPLGGKRWWLQAEDPWQCLAACHELVNAFKLADPSKYISHLPVHQDGTCNGLQHYAALGGDAAGAKQVNLEPGDKPADVYTGVAEMVKAEISSDAAAGVEIAKLLEGRITRKIVKQTVMTNVYGVTFTGAIKQVKKQVDAILPDLTSSGQGGAAAVYIAKKIFMSLGTLFEGAHNIQYWLGDCAQRITHSLSPQQLSRIDRAKFRDEPDDNTLSKPKPQSKARSKKQNRKANESTTFRSTLVWTTPIKLPVVQPYRKTQSKMVETNLQNLCLTEPTLSDAVDHRKQLQAFPPNFIHSLDATHMMLSALKANKLGLTFSAVHDSFWTHAADIDTLNTVLRDEFVRMHSEDIIGRLSAEFSARYGDHLYLAKISPNNPLANKIIEYRKEHGISCEDQHKDLVREVQRRKLLASANPKERQEGSDMVTAATLFEQFAGEKYLHSKVSLGHTAIGEVPKLDPKSVTEALNAPEVKDDIDLENTLESIMEPDANREGEETIASRRKSKKASSGRNQPVWLWLPLTFRDIPKKGEFDVRRLKESTYFFS